MKVLVVGTTGQVGNALMRAQWPRDSVVSGTVRGELDMTRPETIEAALARHMPDLVINATAYTAVDKAETDAATAYLVNAAGVEALAKACAQRGAPLVHISTDYVFDGAGTRAYVETDPIAPLGVYGASKAEGEAAVRAQQPEHVIIRTSWVYSDHGNNFVKTMLRLGGERDQLNVVADQHGAPTSAFEIARVIVRIAEVIGKARANERSAQVIKRSALWGGGTYHFADRGETTWHGFAEHIFADMQRRTGRRPVSIPIPTSAYPTPAKRPSNSRLDCAKIEAAFGITRQTWQQSLDQVLALLAGEKRV